MSGFDNDIVYAKNADFTQADNQNVQEANGLAIDGQVWIGTTATNAGGTHVNVGTITSPDGSITIGYSSPNITAQVGGGTTVLKTLSDDVGTVVTPSAGNIQLVGHVVEAGATKFSTVTAGTNLLNLNPMSSARWIVDPLGFNGTHTTIQSAINSATAGDTVFVLPNNAYVENLTLKNGVNINCLPGYYNNTTIQGNMTAPAGGTVSITGFKLVGSAAAFLTVSGTSNAIVFLNNCFLLPVGTVGINITSSSNPQVFVINCIGDVNVASSIFFSNSSTGFIKFIDCNFDNTTNITGTCMSSAGTIYLLNSTFNFPITTSSTGAIVIENSNSNTSNINTTFLTHGGTGANSKVVNSEIVSGTASAVSIGTGATLTMAQDAISSSNTNAITGAGTLQYSDLSFTDGSSLINTTTQTALYSNLGKYKASGQPCFEVKNTGSLTNVTGDGTTYTILYPTTTFDQNSNYAAGTGLFTAPVAGRYLFCCSVGLSGLGAGHTSAILQITTTTETIEVFRGNPIADAVSGQVTYAGSCIANMNSGDTCKITITVSGSTKTVSVTGAPASFFSGSQIA